VAFASVNPTLRSIGARDSEPSTQKINKKQRTVWGLILCSRAGQYRNQIRFREIAPLEEQRQTGGHCHSGHTFRARARDAEW